MVEAGSLHEGTDLNKNCSYYCITMIGCKRFCNKNLKN
jgi:hypothetical protein